MRRQWFLTLIKSQLGVNTPEEFFLRPALEWGKFPAERHIELSAELQERIRAQDAAGHLVFETATPPARATRERARVTVWRRIYERSCPGHSCPIGQRDLPVFP